MVQNSACIAISHLTAICLNALSHLVSSFFLFTLSCCTSLISLSTFRLLSSCLHSHGSIAFHFPSLTLLLCPPHHRHHRHHTRSQPAASEPHLICSPLRLSDTQHPHRSWGEASRELMKLTPLLSWQSANIWAHESLNDYSVWECMWIPFEYVYTSTEARVSVSISFSY